MSSYKSNAYKNVFSHDRKSGVGKEEFLARRKLFLEMAQNENQNKNQTFSKPKPKPIPSYKKNDNSKSTSNSKFSTNYLSTTSTTKASTSTTKKSPLRSTDFKATTGLAGFSNPKSNSLKSILSQVGRGNQYVSTEEFHSRRKAFEDAQTNDITQLLPRPSTPSGYTYYGRSSPLLTCERPWSPASERPWSPAYERNRVASPTPSFDSERSFNSVTKVRLPWERPSTKKSTTGANNTNTKTQLNSTSNLVDEKKTSTNYTKSFIPDSPTLSATPITSDEPIAIPITNDTTAIHHTQEDLLNEKLKMWYSKVDEELVHEEDKENTKNNNNNITIQLNGVDQVEE